MISLILIISGIFFCIQKLFTDEILNLLFFILNFSTSIRNVGAKFKFHFA